ncbi:hypothetical protein AB6A40_003964 [Gnathostoma spinigerum]|uniref:G-protein coupled receptors family 1 profile domain-containing protein n=1 Tax=Gnathostoma spinigerum TaxID=75299 RepID=A0ABD6EB33_9BILA
MFCSNDPPLFDLTKNSTKEFLHFLETFQKKYAPVHGLICVAICAFGVITNLFHVLVLTRPKMRCSAVNCVLTAVAICDMGTMASYLVYIVHFVLQQPTTCSPTYTHLWMLFLIFHVVISIALHTTSLWLVVAMAFIRRMTIRVAQLNSEWLKPYFAWRLCFLIYVSVFILCIPTMLVHDIVEYHHQSWTPPPHCVKYYPVNYTASIYTIHIPASAANNGCRFFKLNLWMTGVLFKVIPCVLLVFLSFELMLKLHEAHKKHSILLTRKASDSSRRHSHSPERTTAMLLIILFIFLITEMPQGILAILNAIYTTHIHVYIYFNLGDILDLLSLLNSSVNFVLYCFMSSRYRKTFWTVVLPKKLHRYLFADPDVDFPVAAMFRYNAKANGQKIVILSKNSNEDTRRRKSSARFAPKLIVNDNCNDMVNGGRLDDNRTPFLATMRSGVDSSSDNDNGNGKAEHDLSPIAM